MCHLVLVRARIRRTPWWSKLSRHRVGSLSVSRASPKTPPKKGKRTMQAASDTWRACRMPCRGSSRASLPGCPSGRHSCARRSTSSSCRRPAQNTHGHCFALMQLRPPSDNRVGGVSSLKIQCELKDASNVIRFLWPVEFLLRILVPSFPARHARRCKAELPAVHRRAAYVHQECNTKTTRGNSIEAAPDCQRHATTRSQILKATPL